MISCVCDCVCLSVFLSVRALKGERLELSTPKLVWTLYSVAGPRHLLTSRSKCQRSRLQGYQVRCPHGSAGRHKCRFLVVSYLRHFCCVHVASIVQFMRWFYVQLLHATCANNSNLWESLQLLQRVAYAIIAHGTTA